MERLAGTPPGDELLSARSRAALAAALLAAGSAPAAPALAGEPDTEQEGGVDDKPPAGDTDPGFDEGRGGDTDLPDEDGADMPPTGDGGGVERAPEHESIPPESDPESDPEDPLSVPEPPGVPPPAPAPPPTSVPPEIQTPRGLRAPPGVSSDRKEHPGPRTRPLQRQGPPPSAPRSSTPGQERQPPAERTAPTDTATGPAVADEVRPARTLGEQPTGKVPRSRPGVRTHVVRQGECLWSIAHDQLGGAATPAQVARLVNRLWELNQERIATGEPDLLMVGTELQLP